MSGAACDERVALGERARVARAKIGESRPQRGGELVEMRAPQRRTAAHELEPLGQEDDHQRPRCPGAEALDGRAVDAQVLVLARLEADLEQVQPVFSLYLSFSPSDLGGDPHELALVRRPA